MLDVEAGGISAAEFRHAILDNGALVLRNAVPQELVQPLSAAVLAMIDHYNAIPPDVIRREMAFETPEWKARWDEVLNGGRLYNPALIIFSQGRHSLFDVLRKTSLQSLIEQAWPEMRIEEHHNSNVRRMFPGERIGYADIPLGAHIDAMVHQHVETVINLWTPLTDAGREAPGLAVVPMSVVGVKNYLEYNPDGYDPKPGDFAHKNCFRCERLDDQHLRDAGFEFERPILSPGDVLAMSNYTIHATSLAPHMTRDRTSAEVRLVLREGRAPALTEM